MKILRALLALGFEATVSGDEPTSAKEYAERVVVHGPGPHPSFSQVMEARAALPDDAQPITVLQFSLGLWRRGEITPEEAQAFAGSDAIPAPLLALIEQIPDEETRKEVKIRAAGAVEFRIDHPFVKMIAQKKGWSPQELGEFWRFCRQFD